MAGARARQRRLVRALLPCHDARVRTISASSTIDAPLDAVWAVLSDLADYPSWSPFVVAVDGALQVGTMVTLHVAMTPGKEPLRQKERVSRVDAPADGKAELSWGTVMGHPLVLKAERYQRLRALGPGQTLYETADDFEGLLVPIVFSLYRKSIQRGFDETARALKARCERSGAS
jgi:hypothetical protein